LLSAAAEQYPRAQCVYIGRAETQMRNISLRCPRRQHCVIGPIEGDEFDMGAMPVKMDQPDTGLRHSHEIRDPVTTTFADGLRVKAHDIAPEPD